MTEWKKEWTEPELIVLVRNKPEEAVLGGCKDGAPLGPAASDEACMITECLGNCSFLAAS